MSKIQEWIALCKEHGFKSGLDKQESLDKGYTPSKSLSVEEAKRALIEAAKN